MTDRTKTTNGPEAPYRSIPEFSARAIALGLILAVIMGASNTYLGLFAGMTVSASIPAAVLSMGILRGVMRRGTILENNIVQTIASTGESLAAGIIFTVPALVISGAWDTFRYWEVTWISLLGGALGVLFMVPIRRAFIAKETGDLVYPEGVACAQVLEAGEKGGAETAFVFSGIGAGSLFKFLIEVVHLIPGKVSTAFTAGKTVLYGGLNLSPALLSVGYIVGLRISVLVFSGGIIAWCVALPLASTFGDIHSMDHKSASEIATELWEIKLRYIGIGAMLIGGIWSIVSVRSGIIKGLSAVFGSRHQEAESRTQQDMKPGELLPLFLLAGAGVYFLYWVLTSSPLSSAIMMVLMVVAAFFFVAVSSYVVGLVGSSNNPVSGMTITTMLFASGLLLLLGFKGDSGIVAALGIAGVVCCSACTAGDISQDLKTGYIVGATPRKQQWAELIGVAVPAFTIAPVLVLLHRTYTIGQPPSAEHPSALPAPQASLFASLARQLFKEGGIPWTMVLIGIVLGVGLVVTNEYLKAKGSKLRTHCMPVAVGIYLPLGISATIFLGGITDYLVRALFAERAENSRTEAMHRGTLIASGLIAGEAIMGIVAAIFVYFG